MIWGAFVGGQLPTRRPKKSRSRWHNSGVGELHFKIDGIASLQQAHASKKSPETTYKVCGHVTISSRGLNNFLGKACCFLMDFRPTGWLSTKDSGSFPCKCLVITVSIPVTGGG